MKRIIILMAFATFIGTCNAQDYYSAQEHHLLLYFYPKVIYTMDTEKEKPAGYEVSIPTEFKKISTYNGVGNFSWSFLILPSEETIGIQTPMLPYCGTTTILKIIDTVRTVVQNIPFDSLQNQIPEHIFYAKKNFKRIPFLKQRKKRVNQMIRNDSLVIYLINIKPKNIDRFRKTVTMPVKEN